MTAPPDPMFVTLGDHEYRWSPEGGAQERHAEGRVLTEDDLWEESNAE